jgi:hypothetical protein
MLLAVLVLGCDDDEGPTGTEGPFLEVTPPFRGIEEGETVQLTATLGGNPVAVTWESGNTAIATVSPTGLVTGVAGATLPVPITATMSGDASQRRSASITVIALTGTGLQNGVPVTISSSGARGSGQLFRIRVPTGSASLTVTLRGGSGDADIYVQRQTPPDNSGDATCFSFNAGNNEDCVIPAPEAGTWYILVDLWDPYAGATLTATYAP